MKFTTAFPVLALIAAAMAAPTEQPADLEVRNSGYGSFGGEHGGDYDEGHRGHHDGDHDGGHRGGRGGGRGGSCNASGERQVCCNGLLSCVVQLLGSNCNNEAYCCETGTATGGLINLNLLNCVKLL
ncbi:hypothetical protein HIM_06786 [Hirsutella minnesotensis 3608]|uniref:Hydrophobin n=1 Tax=Hirsutella minnesotensis 3608 TaxID=1043627 RepID=A0A0F7ZTX9_9HYPO|nr:hypothetical protein HIM_06786 [Hirsutella minnesotensis 3608]